MSTEYLSGGISLNPEDKSQWTEAGSQFLFRVQKLNLKSWREVDSSSFNPPSEVRQIAQIWEPEVTVNVTWYQIP